MTVNPGFKGQNLVEQTIPKIKDAKRLLDSLQSNASVGVDGNVSLSNIPRMIASGASYLVAGSSGLFVQNQDLEISLKRFKEAIDAAGS